MLRVKIEDEANTIFARITRVSGSSILKSTHRRGPPDLPARWAVAVPLVVILVLPHAVYAQIPTEAAAAAIRHLQVAELVRGPMELGVSDADREGASEADVSARFDWLTAVSEHAGIPVEDSDDFGRIVCDGSCGWATGRNPLRVSLPIRDRGEQGLRFEIRFDGMHPGGTSGYGRGIVLRVVPGDDEGLEVEIINVVYGVWSTAVRESRTDRTGILGFEDR